MQVVESAVYEWCQRFPLAFAMKKDILSTCCNNKKMWCDTCDFLRYNSCQSCLSLFMSCHVMMSCHVAVPSSTTLATMRCQIILSPEALMSSVELTLSFHDSSKLSGYFSLWRPLAFLPSLLPVTTKLSRPCFLNMCPRKASCRWRIFSLVSLFS